MNGGRRTLLLLVAMVALAAWPTAHAFQGRPPRAEIFRLVGVWGPPQKDHVASADLELELHGKPVHFQVEESITIAGSRLGSELLNDIAQYHPALRLTGPKELLQQLAELDDGASVAITGYRPLASRYFMVSAVEAREPQ